MVVVMQRLKIIKKLSLIPFAFAVGLSLSSAAFDNSPNQNKDQPPRIERIRTMGCDSLEGTVPQMIVVNPSLGTTVFNDPDLSFTVQYIDLTKEPLAHIPGILEEEGVKVNSLEAKLNGTLRGVDISISHIPTRVGYPVGENGESLMLADGHKMGVNVSGIIPVLSEKKAGISATGDLEGFVQPVRYSENGEFSGEGKTFGVVGELGTTLAGILNKTVLYISGKAGSHMYVFDGGQYADGTLDNQAVSGLNYNLSAGFDANLGRKSSLAVSVDSKGIADVNEESTDLRWKATNGINVEYVSPKGNELDLRLAGEKEAGDQIPYTNVFTNANATIPFSNIAEAVKGDAAYPDWLNHVKFGIGYSGAVHMSGPEVKYAEDDARGGWYFGLSGDTEFGTFCVTADFNGQLTIKYKSN